MIRGHVNRRRGWTAINMHISYSSILFYSYCDTHNGHLVLTPAPHFRAPSRHATNIHADAYALPRPPHRHVAVGRLSDARALTRPPDPRRRHGVDARPCTPARPDGRRACRDTRAARGGRAGREPVLAILAPRDGATRRRQWRGGSHAFRVWSRE
ncbi:hypothetical protein CC85DRAFT_204397 [Cutaneotrichosporon oleaginosum]|uniref:Uncharacterized protein n=1 Tax=Cutaneotrichosporon oleaginosum TaxID=879819 RepID=A0A0J0XDX6_9TREE|nr:uncharacterized protein CC85DRAFT_204397 [Cutaneotrichosporon oleaginosum]KLT39218.1 hypothetical protein CC85DRAFT_204397 [Cutaneotrichosporon oleaginosum]TXT05711.1 hypothetical protein COLE_07031 [Cutaneotrichosporon oleaginosum]